MSTSIWRSHDVGRFFNDDNNLSFMQMRILADLSATIPVLSSLLFILILRFLYDNDFRGSLLTYIANIDSSMITIALSEIILAAVLLSSPASGAPSQGKLNYWRAGKAATRIGNIKAIAKPKVLKPFRTHYLLLLARSGNF
uniref:Uncharacterized protein n=1 Tax=Glossina pallidipes TaxID=7398 RepID=A0A1B0A8E8_GLOPL